MLLPQPPLIVLACAPSAQQARMYWPDATPDLPRQELMLHRNCPPRATTQKSAAYTTFVCWPSLTVNLALSEQASQGHSFHPPVSVASSSACRNLRSRALLATLTSTSASSGSSHTGRRAAAAWPPASRPAPVAATAAPPARSSYIRRPCCSSASMAASPASLTRSATLPKPACCGACSCPSRSNAASSLLNRKLSSSAAYETCTVR